MNILRVIATILAGPMLLIGVIWIFQGIGVLPGSFMTGNLFWTWCGIPLALAGAALVWWVNRRRA